MAAHSIPDYHLDVCGQEHTFQLRGHNRFGNDYHCVMCLWAEAEEYDVTKKSVIEMDEMLLTDFGERRWDDITFKDVISHHNSPTEDEETIDHYERMMESELDYPIIITRIGDKYEICDGNHRYLKAKLLNEPLLYKIV